MDYALPFLRPAARPVPVTHPGMTEHELRTRRLAVKRAAAINALGASWVMHPDYNPALHPHHRPSHKDSMVLMRVANNARLEGRL